jgi:hypothetical protein
MSGKGHDHNLDERYNIGGQRTRRPLLMVKPRAARYNVSLLYYFVSSSNLGGNYQYIAAMQGCLIK